VFFKQHDFAVFIYGYAKNEKADLDPREEQALRVFAKELSKLSPAQRLDRTQSGALIALE
jgi:hypothetical protein